VEDFLADVALAVLPRVSLGCPPSFVRLLCDKQRAEVAGPLPYGCFRSLLFLKYPPFFFSVLSFKSRRPGEFCDGFYLSGLAPFRVRRAAGSSRYSFVLSTFSHDGAALF